MPGRSDVSFIFFVGVNYFPFLKNLFIYLIFHVVVDILSFLSLTVVVGQTSFVLLCDCDQIAILKSLFYNVSSFF